LTNDQTYKKYSNNYTIQHMHYTLKKYMHYQHILHGGFSEIILVLYIIIILYKFGQSLSNLASDEPNTTCK